MENATEEFFAALDGSMPASVSNKAQGSLRFDLKDGNRTLRWLIKIGKSEIEVSRENRDADCILRADKADFDKMASGEMNAMAAALRGAITAEGDPRLLVLFQRLLPAPVTPGAESRGRSQR